MQSSALPTRLQKVWAVSATGTYVRTVPLTTADPNAASFDLGFPPNVFVDVAAGGKPPDGRDFNGAYKILSAWVQWIGAGGPITWDSTFSTAIGGYPKGALVQSSTFGGFWLNNTENNTTNPNSGGAGWQNLFPQTITGNAATSSKWAAAITVTATGDVSGSVAFDGSANASFNLTVATMTGDAGSGGIKGLVPAPAAGDAPRVLTGAGTFAPIGLRAFVSFNGATGAILDSYGVGSVVRNSTGNYTINWSPAMPNANYCAVGMCRRATSRFLIVSGDFNTPQTSASLTVTTQDQTSFVDAAIVSIQVASTG